MLPPHSVLILAAGLVAATIVTGIGGGPLAPPVSPQADATAPASSPHAATASPPQSDTPPPTSNGPIFRGTIADEAGKPIAGVKVQLYSGLATRWEGQSAVTGEDGTYVFDPLETGAMTRDEGSGRWDYYVGVRIEHDTHVPKEGESWFDLTVPSVDQQVTTRDFVMMTGGVLDGEVKMQDGFGWSELDLRLMPVSGKGTHWYVTTDRKGRFATRAVVPGEYSVQWNSPAADYPELAHVKIEPGQRTSVKVIATIRVEAKAESAAAPLKPAAEQNEQGQQSR